jgi:hypothetical protein
MLLRFHAQEEFSTKWFSLRAKSQVPNIVASDSLTITSKSRVFVHAGPASGPTNVP